MRYKLLSLLFLIFGCKSQELKSTNPIDIRGYVSPPKPELIYYESYECKEALKINKYRNIDIDKRFNECVEKNNEIDCMRWIYGYLEDGHEGK